MFEIGKVVTKQEFPKASTWANKNNASVKLIEGEYVIVSPADADPTLEEKVAKLEAETGLTRIMREMVLAEGSGASEYVKAKAQEIEELASQLRTAEEASEVEEVVVSETEKVEGWE